MHMGECPDAMASDENIRVAWCLHDAGLKCQDTNDEAQEVRFHHLDHASQVAALSWNSGQSKQVRANLQCGEEFHMDKTKVWTRKQDRGIRRYHAIYIQKFADLN